MARFKLLPFGFPAVLLGGVSLFAAPPAPSGGSMEAVPPAAWIAPELGSPDAAIATAVIATSSEFVIPKSGNPAAAPEPASAPKRTSLAERLAARKAAAASAPAAPRGRTGLDLKYERLATHPRWKGPGPEEVVRVAYETLRDGKARGEWPDVGLEDLLAHALQEAGGLMERPDRMWGATGAAETKDFLGQTTIGIWQITVANARGGLGRKRGIDAGWTPEQVVDHCTKNPGVQAAMISDLIQGHYTHYGRRSPYAIQSYFWLGPFLKGEAGKGPWDASVLTRPMTNSGFYAKQIVCGVGYQPYGILYWLGWTDSWDEIRDLAAVWRNQRKLSADARSTDESGGFELSPDDLKYVKDQLIREKIAACLTRPVR